MGRKTLHWIDKPNHHGSPINIPTYTKKWHTQPTSSISPLRPELSAKGKVIVITGGGSGIGLSVAKAFAQAGASQIGIIGRREDILKSSIEEITKYSTDSGTGVEYAVADVTIASQITAAFKDLAERMGKINVFVSNAGFMARPAPVTEAVDDVEWWTAFETNVKGTLHSLRAFLVHASPTPMVLSMNSGFAHLDPIPGFSSYAASKAAALRLVDYFRRENPDLHAVCLQPGVVRTEMSGKRRWKGGWDHEDLPAHFAVWLASPEARFLNGKFVWANWDVEELREREVETSSSGNLQIGLVGLMPPVFAFEEVGEGNMELGAIFLRVGAKMSLMDWQKIND
ncbi:hypothetical protein HYALB_00006275 [Hymenoscyphus albidus]|uniref:Ketoreductase domain-containing protein n=1 Tax=Hymenoscyphus albidus TaxID=595503 RepID=A0A9N9M5Y5_9HELO|nr:hypothetical protein HYALB_00006275 [Hymenoscyphus albidus]